MGEGFNQRFLLASSIEGRLLVRQEAYFFYIFGQQGVQNLKTLQTASCGCKMRTAGPQVRPDNVDENWC